MEETFILEMEFPTENGNSKIVEIEIKCEYCVENNGIGYYEYCGCKGYDRGTDCAIIEKTIWNKANFNDDENRLIGLEVKKNINGWGDAIMDRRSRRFCHFD